MFNDYFHTNDLTIYTQQFQLFTQNSINYLHTTASTICTHTPIANSAILI